MVVLVGLGFVVYVVYWCYCVGVVDDDDLVIFVVG